MNKRALKRIPLNRLMDLKVDFAFKQLFGSEKNKHILIVFLNAILKRTGNDVIQHITFENTEIVGEYEGDKQSRLDLLVQTKSNEWINIEMQFSNKFDMVKRTLYYWSKIYAKPLNAGMVYKELNPVITINILNFDLFKQTNQFHSTYHLYEDTTKERLTDMMEVHFFEIPKLLLDWKAEKLDPWNDVLARWLLLLGIVDHRKGSVYEDIYKELEEIAMEDKQLFDAFEHWQELSMSDSEYFAYLNRLKRIKDEEAVIIEAKLREEEAVEKATKEAIKKGLEQGIKQGIEQGRKVEKVAMASTLLKKGMDVAFVAEVSKLTVEEVIEIQKNIDANF